jgi:hypothetical protein
MTHYPRNEEVAQYSGMVVDTARELIPSRIGRWVLPIRIGIIFGVKSLLDDVVGVQTQAVAYNISGAVAGGVEAIADLGSTRSFVKEMQDPRFFEYGLDDYFQEGLPLLPRHNGGKILFGAALLKSITTSFSYFFPPFGYGVLATSPMVYIHNTSSAKRIRMAKIIGDEVKDLVNVGKRDEEIRQHLDQIVQNSEIYLAKLK